MFTSRTPCPPETGVPGRLAPRLTQSIPHASLSEKTRATLRYRYRRTPPAHPFPIFRSLFKQRPTRLRAGRRLIGPVATVCQQPATNFLIFRAASVDFPRDRRASSPCRRFRNAVCSRDRPARRQGVEYLRCLVATFCVCSMRLQRGSRSFWPFPFRQPSRGRIPKARAGPARRCRSRPRRHPNRHGRPRLRCCSRNCRCRPARSSSPEWARRRSSARWKSARASP